MQHFSWPTCLILWITVLLLAGIASGQGALLPWTTYEAENGKIGGTSANITGPSFKPYTTTAESSNRKCVFLVDTGDYVEVVAQTAANALVVRYSLPDAKDGKGIHATLSLYLNNQQKAKLAMTSTYSYRYGAYPCTNNPADGNPRGHYDEVRLFNVIISSGDRIRLQKNSDDTSPYYAIDFFETELVPAAVPQPSGYINAVTDCDVPTDGVTNVVSSLQACIFKQKPVYVPPGNYLFSGNLYLVNNSVLQGAGMWYTNFMGDPKAYSGAGNRVRIYGQSNALAADFAIIGALDNRVDSETNDGVTGNWGTNSRISRIWIEHTKTGFWLTDSQNLVVDSCRVRNTIADGINLCSAMSNTTVRNAAHRNTGDDSFAMWPMGGGQYKHGGNVFVNCTGQLAWLAQGGSIYGGQSNSIQNCHFVDYTYGCGVLISSTFPVSDDFAGTTTVTNTKILRSGGFDQTQWRAGVQLYPDRKDITGLKITNVDIHDSASNGISVRSQSGKALTNTILSDLDVPNSGLGPTDEDCYGFYVNNKAQGSLTLTTSKIATSKDDSPNFVVHNNTY